MRGHAATRARGRAGRRPGRAGRDDRDDRVTTKRFGTIDELFLLRDGEDGG